MTGSGGGRWIDRWNAYWFPTTSTRDLAICRIVAVAAQLLWFFPNLHEHVNLVRKNPEFIEPQMLIRGLLLVVPRDLVFTPQFVTTLWWATIAVGVLALIGLCTRTTIFLFALGSWFFVAHLFSYGDRHHTEAIYCIFLMLLVLAPSGAQLSVDALLRRRRGAAPLEYSDLASWPLKVAHVLIALTYFSAGITKMLHSGPRWLNGYTLQTHTFGDAMARGHPIGVWLAGQHTLAIGLSVLTIALELFFWVSLFLPRQAPLFILAALGFQLGLYVSAGYDFFQHMMLLVLLLFFLYPSWWRSRLSRASGAA